MSSREDRGWTVVTAVGQLDVATAPGFRQTLQEAQFGGATKVAVDLDGVEFLDSFGLGVLVGGLRRARTHGGGFALVSTRPRLRHLLQVSGLDAAFIVVDHLDDVLDG